AGNPKTKILAKGWKEAIHFLDIWISARNQQRSDMRKAKAE
ncbi:23857_t:CDS:1, partial [Gigaspora margarita]